MSPVSFCFHSWPIWIFFTLIGLSMTLETNPKAVNHCRVAISMPIRKLLVPIPGPRRRDAMFDVPGRPAVSGRPPAYGVGNPSFASIILVDRGADTLLISAAKRVYN